MEMNDQDLNRKTIEALRSRRSVLEKTAEEFKRRYDINGLSDEELNHWIEEMRPIRLEIRAIDRSLLELSLGSDVSLGRDDG